MIIIIFQKTFSLTFDLIFKKRSVKLKMLKVQEEEVLHLASFVFIFYAQKTQKSALKKWLLHKLSLIFSNFS